MAERKRLKIFLGVGCAVLLLSLAAIFVSARKAAVIWPTDEKPIAVAPVAEDPEARARFEELAKAAEAAGDLSQPLFQILQEDALPPVIDTSAWPRPAALMAALDALPVRPGLGLKPLADIAAPQPSFLSLMRAAKYQHLRAIRLVGEGKAEEAGRALAHLQAIGRSLAHADHGLLAPMVGIAIEEGVLGLSEKLLKRFGAEAAPVKAALNLDGPSESYVVLGLKSESRLSEGTIDLLGTKTATQLFAVTDSELDASRGDPGPLARWLFDPGKCKQWSRRHFRQLIEQAEKPAGERQPVAYARLWQRDGLHLGQHFDNPIGRILLDVAAPGFGKYSEKEDELDALRARVAKM